MRYNLFVERYIRDVLHAYTPEDETVSDTVNKLIVAAQSAEIMPVKCDEKFDETIHVRVKLKTTCIEILDMNEQPLNSLLKYIVDNGLMETFGFSLRHPVMPIEEYEAVEYAREILKPYHYKVVKEDR